MYLEMKHISKSFGNFKVSDDVSFGIERGKLVALLGPSGSGKTTILRILAGLEHQDEGDIYIGGKLMNGVSVKDRGIGFVFQNYALFPYLTVHDNIAYGMKLRKKSKHEIQSKVSELLELVGLPGLGSRFPAQLSGGQRQRVAFARALATEPQVLLLDEPFAAIDAKVRKELRHWLKDMIEQVGITSVFVTHDQEEAVEVADELIITNEGCVEQVGTPIDIYKNPQTSFVAQFIGESVILDDYAYEKLRGFQRQEGAPSAAIRPEFVKVIAAGQEPEFPSIYMNGVIRHKEFRGRYTELTVQIGDIELKAEQQIDEGNMKKGDDVKVMVSRLFAFDSKQAYNLVNLGLKNENIYYI